MEYRHLDMLARIYRLNSVMGKEVPDDVKQLAVRAIVMRVRGSGGGLHPMGRQFGAVFIAVFCSLLFACSQDPGLKPIVGCARLYKADNVWTDYCMTRESFIDSLKVSARGDWKPCVTCKQN